MSLEKRLKLQRRILMSLADSPVHKPVLIHRASARPNHIQLAPPTHLPHLENPADSSLHKPLLIHRATAPQPRFSRLPADQLAAEFHSAEIELPKFAASALQCTYLLWLKPAHQASTTDKIDWRYAKCALKCTRLILHFFRGLKRRG